ncbi:MAG: OadG family protein [Muribaculaceae bacterium]|nr:OadG family protein [Muribaculaceae bacterium]
MKKRLLALVVVATAFSSVTFAQSRSSLRINEVMVENYDNIVDEYGERHAWIELFNSSYAPLEISSVYLTNDKNDPKKYPVPLGDANTKIGKRQHVVFFADSMPTRGTFHTSFSLKPGQDNWIGVYDADGITLIDEIVIPANLPARASYARNEDGGEEWVIRDGSSPELYVTPSGANRIVDENDRVRVFKERDESGTALTVMAMCIVFSALLMLCLCFYVIGRINKKFAQLRKIQAHGADHREVPRKERPEADSGEVIAAIAMALNEHLDAHDRESTILTINKVRRAYSPWSSKIYGLRENPHR